MDSFDTLREHYFFFDEISTRWLDNDIYGHINNVTYYSFFDTVANNYLIREGGMEIQTAKVVGFIVASTCQFHAPVAHPARIDAGFRVNRLGSSSVEYGIAIFKNGEDEASANGTFTHVFVDRTLDKSVPIPAEIRSALQRALHTRG